MLDKNDKEYIADQISESESRMKTFMFNNFAAKYDLQEYATKEDLRQTENRIMDGIDKIMVTLGDPG